VVLKTVPVLVKAIIMVGYERSNELFAMHRP
jgi:hypothetical protein